jgi:drug/metabolite transporter (DMT)-like permease
MIAYLAALLCVIGLAVGQLLFKLSATSLAESGTILTPKGAAAFLAAMCLYGVVSVAWVWILQKIELSRVYPLMALAFVLVPLGSYMVFGERFPALYFVGVALIVRGIAVILSL